MIKMKYSVLMTVYNGDNPEYLKLAIESMIMQTITPDEIVIVKDGKISKELQNVIDNAIYNYNSIIEIQLSNNVGLGLALNEGIKACNNELIARMDADDISLPTRCEKQLEIFKQKPNTDIVGCHVTEFSDNIENIVGRRRVPISNEEIYKYAKKRDPFNHPSVMYKKSKVLKVGGYGNYRKNQDTDLWIKMLNDGCVAENLDEYLVLFRFDEKTYKKRKSWINTKLLIQIRKNAYKIGFSSFFDLISVATMQIIIFIMPISIQKVIYKKVLRK